MYLCIYAYVCACTTYGFLYAYVSGLKLNQGTQVIQDWVNWAFINSEFCNDCSIRVF